MATFAGALGRGLAGYGANRERADQRDREIEQQQRAEARQSMLDERQRVQMEQQAQAMKEQRERQAALDAKGNYEDGYRGQAQTGAVGDTIAGAAAVSHGTPFGVLMSGLGSYGRAAQEAGKGPAAFTMGGQPMVKAAESLAEMTARRGVEQRLGERMAGQEFDLKRDAQNATQQTERDTRQNTFTASENAKNRNATMAGITARMSADANQPPAPRTLPMGVESELSSNLASISAIDEAAALLKQPGGKDAFGVKRGLQNMVGIANRADPANTGLRALVSNIGSMQIKLRSGTAVSATEWPRIRGFIPTVYDAPEEVESKLREIRRAISEETSARAAYYQQQGYAIPGQAQQKAPDVRNDRPLPPPAPDMNDPEFRKFLQQQGVIR